MRPGRRDRWDSLAIADDNRRRRAATVPARDRADSTSNVSEQPVGWGPGCIDTSYKKESSAVAVETTSTDHDVSNAPATTILACPQCQGTMRSYERRGVTSDQCHDRRSVLLDRGDVERRIDAEQRRYLSRPVTNAPRDRDQPADDQGLCSHSHGSKDG